MKAREFLAEISKETALRYYVHASNVVRNLNHDYQNQAKQKKPEQLLTLKKLIKRNAGYAMAKKKLTGQSRVGVSEAYDAGSYKLDDGSEITLSAFDAKCLNRLLSSSEHAQEFKDKILSNKTDFRNAMKLARTLK